VGREKVQGVLYFGKQGRAKVVVDGKSEPITLAKGSSGTAIHGDSVELTVLPSKRKQFNQKKRRGSHLNLAMKSEKYLNVERLIFLATCEEI